MNPNEDYCRSAEIWYLCLESGTRHYMTAHDLISNFNEDKIVSTSTGMIFYDENEMLAKRRELGCD